MDFINKVRLVLRGIIKEIAILVDAVSNGAIKPNHVTAVSVLGHVVAMLAIMNGQWVQASLLIIVFGLMDVLDGELARVQSRATAIGAIFDATADRVKEILLFTGLVYYFATQQEPNLAALSVAALGASICVSYIKAKVETYLVSHTSATATSANRTLATGWFGYEVRSTLLIIGLIFQRPDIAVLLIATGGIFTMLQRFHSAQVQLRKLPRNS